MSHYRDILEGCIVWSQLSSLKAAVMCHSETSWLFELAVLGEHLDLTHIKEPFLVNKYTTNYYYDAVAENESFCWLVTDLPSLGHSSFAHL